MKPSTLEKVAELRRKIHALQTKRAEAELSRQARSLKQAGQKPKVTRNRRRRKAAADLPGDELHELFKALGFELCKGCSVLRKKMNRWGSSGCREPRNFAWIINALVPRARQAWHKSHPWIRAQLWWQGNESLRDRLLIVTTAATEDINAALRHQLTIHVDTAINRAEAKARSAAQ